MRWRIDVRSIFACRWNGRSDQRSYLAAGVLPTGPVLFAVDASTGAWVKYVATVKEVD